MNWRAWGAFAALGVIWGLPYFFIKVAVQELSPAVIAFARIALSAAILLPIAWRSGALKFSRAQQLAIGAFALVEFVIPFSLISAGERWISSSVTGILIAMVPFWVALLQRFFGLHEPLGLWRGGGLLLGFCGVAALVGFGTIASPFGWLGVACMLVSTLGYATGPLIIQRHLRGMSAVGPLAASLAVAGLMMLVPALLSLPAVVPSSRALWSLLLLGVLCTAIAMLLMFYLVNHAGAARASVITYINPAVAALLGVVVLHERLGAGGIAAFLMILLGSWLATRAPRRMPAAGAH